MSTLVVSSNTLLTSDNNRIELDRYQMGHDEVVIIAHGFFNSKQACLLQELGRQLNLAYDVIIFDFRGHGRSQGIFTWTSKEPEDLLTVVKYARQFYKKIGLVGFSLGAAISLVVSSQMDAVDSLVAVSAPVSIQKIEYYFWQLDIENDILYNAIGQGWQGKGVRPGPFWLKKDAPIDLVSRIHVPVLYIHGERDWLIKPWHSKALYDKSTAYKKLSIIRDGPHAEYLVRKNKEEFVALIEDWFKQSLKGNV